ncbi:MAG TPA: GDP-L-fucose synthase [Terracidiphilus sp.]|nr:GDP-L-fucose synthase [Terracidiphilus sp.]
MIKSSRIYVAGHRGLVGSAIVRALRASGYNNLILRTRAELDLRDRRAVDGFLASEAPEYVFVAAAVVGGILANSTRSADFLRDNLLIQTNLIDSAWEHGVRKLQFLGSSCIYPKHAPQPISEDALLSGMLEPTNEPYAIAKIAGIKMCQAYRSQYGFNAISLMPANLYGPGDNFNLASSHVLPALIRKFHEARENKAPAVVLWGTGNPRREFLHVDDLADAAVMLMKTYDSPEIVNIGSGVDLSIAELAEMIREIVGYSGEILFDTTKPDGTPRKLLNIERARSLGWMPKIPLRQGIEETYCWFLGSRTEVLAV